MQYLGKDHPHLLNLYNTVLVIFYSTHLHGTNEADTIIPACHLFPISQQPSRLSIFMTHPR